MGSHSVTCHPADVTFPPLPQPKLVLNLATPEGCKAELTWVPIICARVPYGLCLVTMWTRVLYERFRSQVVASTFPLTVWTIVRSAETRGIVVTIDTHGQPWRRHVIISIVTISDGQIQFIQIMIWFKSWSNHWWFDVSTKKLIWKHVIWFYLNKSQLTVLWAEE